MVSQKNYFGWITSWTCQNVSTSGDTQLTITYSGKPSYTHPTILGPGDVLDVFVNSDTHLPDSTYIGGATIEATNSLVDIACTVGFSNPLKRSTVSAGDWGTRQNGFPK